MARRDGLPFIQLGGTMNDKDFIERMELWNLEGDGDSYPCVKMSDINRLIGIIDRKDALLKEALEQLLAVEWEVNIGTIARIEDEIN